MSTLRSGGRGLSTASCLTVLALILLGAFALITYLTGNFKAAEYLRILNVKGTGELTVFC